MVSVFELWDIRWFVYRSTRDWKYAMGEIEKSFDMKAGQGSVDEDVESIGSSNLILGPSFGRQRSEHQYDYPIAPSPLHFTHLNSPKPASNSYFMPSPLRIDNKRRRRRRGRCRLFICCCCCTLFSLLGTSILVALITWLVLRPIYFPRFTIDTFEFQTLEASDSDSLSATAFFTITAENRNKRLGFKYDAIGVDASYRGYVFGHSEVPSFSLGHRNVTTLSSEFFVENFSFSPGEVGKQFSNDLELERVEVQVRARAKVRLKNTPFALFKVLVNCDLALKPPSDHHRVVSLARRASWQGDTDLYIAVRDCHASRSVTRFTGRIEELLISRNYRSSYFLKLHLWREREVAKFMTLAFQ